MRHILTIGPGHPQLIQGVAVTAGIAVLVVILLTALIMVKQGGWLHYLVGVLAGVLLGLSMSGHIGIVTKYFTTHNPIPTYIIAVVVLIAGIAVAFTSGMRG
jgi:hypothetical protein